MAADISVQMPVTDSRRVVRPSRESGTGCTREEIKDTLIQLAIYAGIPAGVEAFRLAREVLAEVDADT